jgi:hypothetical protein
MQLTIANRIRNRQVEIILRGDRRKLALRIEKVVRNGSSETFRTQASANVLDQ